MIQPTTYSERRQKIAAFADVVAVAGYDATQQQADMAHAFTQEANFFYLTGIVEAGWQLILSNNEWVLVSPQKDATHRLFDGGLSAEEAIEISGVDAVVTPRQAKVKLRILAEQHKTVWSIGPDAHAKYYDFALNPAPPRLWRYLQRLFSDVRDIRPELAKHRAIKSQEEIDLIRQAVQVTSQSFERIKASIDSYGYEYEVEAAFTYDFRRHGLNGHAYSPIVAAGANACTLHYGKNAEPLKNGELILLDVGANAGGYAADITRTYSRGEATGRQRAVHDAVERAQGAIINLIKPGVALKEYQRESDDIMKEALASLGLLNKPSDYRRYFPHAVSHGLGIDVHESLGGYDTFQPGMVLTVEPGIYIPEEGIGVRIEDDILVTEQGNENLSAQLPMTL